MLKAYQAYWKGYVDFKGKTSVGGYWWAFLANTIAMFAVSLFSNLVFSGRPERGGAIPLVFLLLCLLPSLAIMVRRLRDGGYKWTSIFWAFLPIAGPIVLLVRLCMTSGDSASYRPVAQQRDASGAPVYQTYARPTAAQSTVARQENGPGVLLVRFNIDQLNQRSGSYGFQSGKLIGQVVPPSLLEGMTIRDGDSAATLRGNEYVCIVSISTASDRSILRERIEPLILASEDIKHCGAPPITQIVSSSNEPLVEDGIVRAGKIEGAGGWCASGFMSAWKEQGVRAEAGIG